MRKTAVEPCDSTACCDADCGHEFLDAGVQAAAGRSGCRRSDDGLKGQRNVYSPVVAECAPVTALDGRVLFWAKRLTTNGGDRPWG